MPNSFKFKISGEQTNEWMNEHQQILLKFNGNENKNGLIPFKPVSMYYYYVNSCQPVSQEPSRIRAQNNGGKIGCQHNIDMMHDYTSVRPSFGIHK